MQVNVVTPQRHFLSQQSKSVSVPGESGQMQVLSGHASCLAKLKPGLVVCEADDGEKKLFAISDGFLQVEQDHINIICEQAFSKEEIDYDHERELLAQFEQDQGDSAVLAKAVCLAKLSLFEK